MESDQITTSDETENYFTENSDNEDYDHDDPVMEINVASDGNNIAYNDDENEDEYILQDKNTYEDDDVLQNKNTYEDELSSEDELNFDNENNSEGAACLSEPLYENSTITVGETITELLRHFFENAETKKSLKDLLKMFSLILPKPNNVSKTLYYLMKIINQIMPSHKDALIRHRFCEECDTYLGHWTSETKIKECNICHSPNVNGLFLEYDMRTQIKDAFEVRKLDDLILDYTEEIKNRDPNFIYDIVDGTQYKQLLKSAATGKFDIILQWNTDGAPIANSSKAQIWPVQAQILNIHPNRRRSFQIICGLYYSTKKKPAMNTVLRPFAYSLKEMCKNGVEWKQKSTEMLYTSKVFAPVASLDAPAKAAVQNLMQYNGKFGCYTCEIEGESYKTDKGGTAHVYPHTEVDPPLRSHLSMLTSASKVIQEELEHDKGVKGPSATANIPFFNLVTGFVQDYLHIVLKGVGLALILLWTDTSNHSKPFYISKKGRNEIDKELSNLFPPDEVTRTSRTLENLSFWKASELKFFILFYSPILLKGRLETKFYEHYIMFVHAIYTLLQSKISKDEIDLADTLLYIFVMEMQNLYGKRYMSYNVHQLRHLAPAVLLWGTLFSSSTFPFEDGNGYLKRIKHGPNKVDVEIFNTMKLLNAFQILKHKQPKPCQPNLKCIQSLGASQVHVLNPNEIFALKNANLNHLLVDENKLLTCAYSKVKVGKLIYTSELYTRQKKRNNRFVAWNNTSSFGTSNSFFAVIQESTLITDPRKLITHKETNIVLDYLKPTRETYVISIIPVEKIERKLICVDSYVCTLPNPWETKM